MSSGVDQERISHEQTLADNDSAVESCEYLAKWHLSRNSYRTARKYLGHLTALKRTSADVWYSLCVCSCAGGDLEEATVALQEAERLSGETESSPRVILCKALIAERRGEHKEALTYLESIIGEYTELEKEALSLGQEVNPANVGAGSSNTHDNVAHENQICPKHSMGSVPLDIRGEALLHIAAVKKDMGDFEGAISVCSAILSDPPSHDLQANTLCLQGISYELKEDYKSAELAYRNCCNVIPTHILGLERLGRLYLRFRETLEAAVECFHSVLESCPLNADVWYLLGRCYMASEQYEDAYLAYNEAINCEPNESRIWVSLGILYYSHGQYKESLGMFVRALRLKPKCVEAWYNLGVVYEVNGNQMEADKAYIKAKENGLGIRLEEVGLTLHEPSLL